ncbi:hypothetical protein [Xanthobacter wiegelii]|uniref:hypothetical protein n=1 Tax=Xanthobacter wiegelii TaxID=3119913 RepID=UPI0037275E06
MSYPDYMNRIIVCRQQSCERPFSLIEIGGDQSGRTHLETVICPHCGASWQVRAGGVFRTARLTAVAEEVWLEEQSGSTAGQMTVDGN